MSFVCPSCGAVRQMVKVAAPEMNREADLREEFVNRRLDHRPSELERMDLTNFMHGGTGRLLSCARCGLLFREEQQTADYQHDAYDSALMGHLYPRYLRAFEKKKSLYKPLLPERAEVVEVGSHLGAFLEAAEGWGWRPTGLDIGRSTGEFARRRGLSVKHLTLGDYSPRLARPDAVFIWNCFEQLPDPGAALRESQLLLGRDGLLIVRVPNAQFYGRTREQLFREDAVRLLGYNNLLGFPYLYGYTYSNLAGVLKSYGFTPVARHNSSLLTPPYPNMTEWVQREWSDVRRNGDGPWIEIVSRKTSPL